MWSDPKLPVVPLVARVQQAVIRADEFGADVEAFARRGAAAGCGLTASR
jgi:hypothetical protein